MAYNQNKETIKLPAWVADLDGADRRDIADAVVQFIRDRSETGVGVKKVGEGKWRAVDFADYTEAYAKFKGVSRSRVDLRLSSEMLEDLDVLKVGVDSIVIGYAAGEINGKVEGNRLGTYGNSQPLRGKARDFIGITRDDLALILDPYKPRR